MGSYKKRRKVINWLIKQSYTNSIFMLQETHSTALVEQKWQNQWHRKMFFSHGTSNSTGVLICITEDLDCRVNNELHDKNGRILIIDIEIQSEHYVIINYYSNNDQHGQLETLSVLESRDRRMGVLAQLRPLFNHH